MARALITGVAGFIGSSIAKGLLAEGAEVVGLDNLSSGNEENLASVRRSIDFRIGDIQDPDALEHACRGVDYVYHEAAIPSVPISVADPVGTNGPNLNGTLLVLEAAKRAGVKRLMYAASSAAYGDAVELPCRETQLPSPISPYAVQKVAGEQYLASYSRIYGLETVSLRYFNVFGPHQDPTSQYSGVLAIFISKMLHGETPIIFGDGTTSRDFVYIENVVHANLLAAKAPSSVAGKVFNVATGASTTLLEAYEALRTITGFREAPTFRPERTGDIRHSLADISSIQKHLGYKVQTHFHSGLERTVAWYKAMTPTYA